MSRQGSCHVINILTKYPIKPLADNRDMNFLNPYITLYKVLTGNNGSQYLKMCGERQNKREKNFKRRKENAFHVYFYFVQNPRISGITKAGQVNIPQIKINFGNSSSSTEEKTTNFELFPQ